MRKSAEKQEAQNHAIKVTRAHEFDKTGNVSVDLEVNGVFIYGCTIIEGKNGDFLSFPSKKVDDRYFNHARFDVSEHDLAEIIKQAEALLK